MSAERFFRERYGPWAIIAGASEGLGAAFGHALAARGLNLVLIARRPRALEETAQALRDAHGVEIEARAFDLADRALPGFLASCAAGREIGLGVYNAAYAPVGALLDRNLEDLQRVVDVNVRGPLTFVHTLAPEMVKRHRGGLVLMASLAGLSGSPRLATYAATKAFDIILAESLWGELRRDGVDVLASCAGAIRTPGFGAASGADSGANPAPATKDPPGTLDPEVVAERTIRALGGGPRVVPGVVNQLASLVVGRWLPRGRAVSIMASSTEGLEG